MHHTTINHMLTLTSSSSMRRSNSSLSPSDGGLRDSLISYLYVKEAKNGGKMQLSVTLFCRMHLLISIFYRTSTDLPSFSRYPSNMPPRSILLAAALRTIRSVLPRASTRPSLSLYLTDDKQKQLTDAKQSLEGCWYALQAAAVSPTSETSQAAMDSTRVPSTSSRRAFEGAGSGVALSQSLCDSGNEGYMMILIFDCCEIFSFFISNIRY